MDRSDSPEERSREILGKKLRSPKALRLLGPAKVPLEGARQGTATGRQLLTFDELLFYHVTTRHE